MIRQRNLNGSNESINYDTIFMRSVEDKSGLALACLWLVWTAGCWSSGEGRLPIEEEGK